MPQDPVKNIREQLARLKDRLAGFDADEADTMIISAVRDTIREKEQELRNLLRGGRMDEAAQSAIEMRNKRLKVLGRRP